MRVISNEELVTVSGGDGEPLYFGVDPFPNKCPKGYQGVTLITFTETVTTSGWGGSVTVGGKTTISAGFQGPLPQGSIGGELNGSGTATKPSTTTTRTETAIQTCLPITEGVYGTPAEKHPGGGGGTVGDISEEITNLC